MMISNTEVCHEYRKIAITIEEGLLQRLDSLVKKQLFPNRSRAIQVAVANHIARIERSRLAKECAKLDPDEERALSEEGLSHEIETWPNY